jgi:hypothetical protein
MPLPVIKDQLPIVQEKVGDTWNYGSASDPHKLAEYRALAAHDLVETQFLGELFLRGVAQQRGLTEHHSQLRR